MNPCDGRDNRYLVRFIGREVRTRFGFKSAFRNALRAAHGGRCAYCGVLAVEGQTAIDHVRPQSLGGTDDVENLVLCCKSCNSAKRDGSLLDLRWHITIRNSPYRGIINSLQARKLEALGVDLGFDELHVFHYERYGAEE